MAPTPPLPQVFSSKNLRELSTPKQRIEGKPSEPERLVDHGRVDVDGERCDGLEVAGGADAGVEAVDGHVGLRDGHAGLVERRLDDAVCVAFL